MNTPSPDPMDPLEGCSNAASGDDRIKCSSCGGLIEVFTISHGRSVATLCPECACLTSQIDMWDATHRHWIWMASIPHMLARESVIGFNRDYAFNQLQDRKRALDDFVAQCRAP